MRGRALLTDPDELLLVRRRLPLKAEWLLDRLRLYAVATAEPGEVLFTDLRHVLDGKMTEAEARRHIAFLVDQGLLEVTAGVIQFWDLRWQVDSSWRG